ncbi:unnamed protein product [Staurois parvus]|uniref:IF rod domain-containing protein n=1 Tax=Staurois parvus TaxID=386267 RepID=A0ABN9ARJ5_9NEOB|nr:unnamed protein product [Staurois parvus]
MAFYGIAYPYSGESRRGASLGGNLSGGFNGGLGEGFGGGSSTGFSFSSSAAFGGAQSSSFGGFAGSDKETMQNLNDRLAAYLEKVRALEAANTELEIKIREWHEKQAGIGAGTTDIDYSRYFDTIDDLRNKIQATKLKNSRVELQIDNARMAIDDFRQKKEIERSIFQNVEADVNTLYKVQDELALSRSGLELQVDSLSEELAYLKKNHEEEMHAARINSAGQVDVQMKAAPGIDLTNVLNDMRSNYEALAEKNRADAEAWFAKKSSELKTEISTGMEQANSSKTEISDLRRTLQSFELELQSLMALKKTFEDTLVEAEADYGGQLHQLQLIITGLEEQLLQIRSDTERQSLDYKELFNIKTRLEMEIETYRSLLEGELGSCGGGGGRHSSYTQNKPSNKSAMAFYSPNPGTSQDSYFRSNIAGGFAGASGYGASTGGSFKGGFGGGFSSGFGISSSAGFGGAESSNFGVLSGSGKETMQNLNDRLAAYLENVKALEEANNELEIKIRAWYDKQVVAGAGTAAKDYSKYYDTINGLRSKVHYG